MPTLVECEKTKAMQRRDSLLALFCNLCVKGLKCDLHGENCEVSTITGAFKEERDIQTEQQKGNKDTVKVHAAVKWVKIDWLYVLTIQSLVYFTK